MAESRTVTLLTGQPHIGKSTIIQKIADLTADKSGGFYTREISFNGQRTGFEIVTLNGCSVLLATKDANVAFTQEVHFRGYKVNLEAIDRIAVPALLEAVSSRKLVIVDEIGPIEIFSENFCNVVASIINNPQIAVVGTIVERSYRVADEIKAHPRVTIQVVTFENRDSLPQTILSNL